MKTLLKQLEASDKIHVAEKNTIEEAIKYVYSDDKYKFYLNSELIDVNDRFRVFEYNKKKYVVKKSNISDGNLEVELAQKAIEILDELKVNNYTIRIVKPQIYHINNYSYILTEYMGNSLQELCYSRQKNTFINVETIFEILDAFLKRGVLYRGFLPRNTIIIDKTVYLLDWEDSIFNIKEEGKVNLLWKTNFILNWSYFFDYNILEKKLEKYLSSRKEEPPLIKYEKRFLDIANLNYDNYDARKHILKTVVSSENKVQDETNDFVIPPNDMAHLISDLFNSYIDVLFDITSSILRNKNEKEYIYFLKKISSSIVDSYKNNEIIQKRVMRIILEFMEKTAEVTEKNEVNIVELLETNKNEFLIKLKEILERIIYNFDKKKISEHNLIIISDYIYSFK